MPGKIEEIKPHSTIDPMSKTDSLMANSSTNEAKTTTGDESIANTCMSPRSDECIKLHLDEHESFMISLSLL